MQRVQKDRTIQILIQAIRISLGSCIAIWIAEGLHLSFAPSAGIITLLSILTTKWETLKISLYRLVTFGLSVVLSTIIFHVVSSEWFAFGIFILLLVFITEILGFKSTLSVNAVIGTHFLTTLDFSVEAILNEFLLVLIGTAIAVVLNLFQNNNRMQIKLIKNMELTENKFKAILEELAAYLSKKELPLNVWDHIVAMEKELSAYVEQAYQYQNNTFRSHTSYYVHYFEMRVSQCNVLHNLHYQMKQIRNMPDQAEIIADYITYLTDYVSEQNDPTAQIIQLEELLLDTKLEELPKSREEFENRAILYHILMDLKEFLIFKKRFVDSIETSHKQVYWEKRVKKEKQSETESGRKKE